MGFDYKKLAEDWQQQLIQRNGEVSFLQARLAAAEKVITTFRAYEYNMSDENNRVFREALADYDKLK